MNKYEIRTQQKKDAIIAASLNLFREKGYTNVSINDIAAGSGVSSVSIYNYFGSKEGLVRECARILMRDASREAEKLLEQKIGFKEKLLQVVNICAGQHQQLLAEYFSPDAICDKALVELYTENVNLIRQEILRSFIESGKAEGAIDESISVDTIMDFLGAVGAVQLSWETADDYDTKAMELYKLMLYGLIGHEE